MNDSVLNPPVHSTPHQPTWRFVVDHPAHAIALGLGCGLAPWAPGTVATLVAWFCFALMERTMSDAHWALLFGAGALTGAWACARAARDLKVSDPASIVFDEIVAFWLVLWLISPAGFWAQFGAFALFRVFDAAKPGPVAWADTLFKARRGQPIGWRQGVGIMLDDLVAALCTLFAISLWRFL